MRLPSCGWCGLPIHSELVPRCRECDKPLCSPNLRNCWQEHDNARHSARPAARKVEDLKPL